MDKSYTDKKRFTDLLHRAIQPIAPKVDEKQERKKHGDYNGKQTHQRKSANTSDSPNDKSHQ